eukprot:TRINITY_DN43026_c0_g1_i1.p1 TRINITY_DN43026_c0_g1~~TRINITY_DN43026_c0_g1_i1.p1  ORF type:complete len:953 (+),score=105.46 TRINITY_DN43026_c0_g1_i1:53-2860(+)
MASRVSTCWSVACRAAFWLPRPEIDQRPKDGRWQRRHTAPRSCQCRLCPIGRLIPLDDAHQQQRRWIMKDTQHKRPAKHHGRFPHACRCFALARCMIVVAIAILCTGVIDCVRYFSGRGDKSVCIAGSPIPVQVFVLQSLGFHAVSRRSATRPIRAQCVRVAASRVRDTKLSSQYKMNWDASRAGSGASRIDEGAIFNQGRVLEYIMGKPTVVAKRFAYVMSIVAGIWWAWQNDKEGAAAAAKRRAIDGGYDVTSLRRVGPSTRRGEALRTGLAEMGVFFVKMGQTLAQRPDIVGEEVAQELKGLQERNAPFDDDVALQVMADDLGHRGPLAPGVEQAGCDLSLPPLFQELNPKHVASASLGQVYRARLHDGRDVALKVQRPGANDILGPDWAVAVSVCQVWQRVKGSVNDYTLIVDTVARGIRMELDYHNEAANAVEFAKRHSFLPFVSSPGWVPEYTGPRGSARVLCLEWYPSRAPSELSREERRRLVEMAVSACVIQLLVTGFVHADPHEGNLRLGDDGRLVFLDFGLMDRVDFGVMEIFAAGIRAVLEEDWTTVARCMQEACFTPTPIMRFVNSNRSIEPAELTEFSAVLRKYMVAQEGGTARFGALAQVLNKMSRLYVMLTPPYVALLCRTFITLEGLLGDDPALKSYNIYEVALPFAIRRVLSPRTRKGQVALRAMLLEKDSSSSRPRRRWAAAPKPDWEALANLIGNELSGGSTSARVGTSDAESTHGRHIDLFGATEGVQRRLLRTSEGAALRRFLFDMDFFDVACNFVVSRKARFWRRRAVDELASWMSTWWGERWQKRQRTQRRSGDIAMVAWGPRCDAAAEAWGEWREDDIFPLPRAALRSSRRAWRLVFRRQLRFMIWPPWRLPYRIIVGLPLLVAGASSLALRALIRAYRRRRRESLEIGIPETASDVVMYRETDQNGRAAV